MSARMPELTRREDVPEEAHHIFDAIVRSRGGVRGPLAVLLHSPEVAARVAHLGAYLRFESSLPAPDRELAIITSAREIESEYEWASHAPLAREAGVREEVINIVGRRGNLDELNEREATVVRYTQELLRQRRISNTVFEAARRQLGNRGVMELTATVGYYAMVAYVLFACEVPPPAGGPRFPRAAQ